MRSPAPLPLTTTACQQPANAQLSFFAGSREEVGRRSLQVTDPWSPPTNAQPSDVLCVDWSRGAQLGKEVSHIVLRKRWAGLLLPGYDREHTHRPCFPGGQVDSTYIRAFQPRGHRFPRFSCSDREAQFPSPDFSWFPEQVSLLSSSLDWCWSPKISDLRHVN